MLNVNVLNTVKSVLSFGAEIWGFHESLDKEKVHIIIYFCRRGLSADKIHATVQYIMN